MTINATIKAKTKHLLHEAWAYCDEQEQHDAKAHHSSLWKSPGRSLQKTFKEIRMSHQLKDGMWAKCSSHQEQRAAINIIHAGGKVRMLDCALKETSPDKNQPHLMTHAGEVFRTNESGHGLPPIPLSEFILRALGYWEEPEPQPTKKEPEPIATLKALFAELQSNYQALLEKTERALAAKQEPKQEPEFLKGTCKHFELLENPTPQSPWNMAGGGGIYVHNDYEIVIIPTSDVKDCKVIRFRKRK